MSFLDDGSMTMDDKSLTLVKFKYSSRTAFPVALLSRRARVIVAAGDKHGHYAVLLLLLLAVYPILLLTKVYFVLQLL